MRVSWKKGKGSRERSKSQLDFNLDYVAARFSSRVYGVEVKRRTKFGTNQKCFVGMQAVDWFVENFNVDRAAAIDLGMRLWLLGVFRHVKFKKKAFCDEFTFFSFSSDCYAEADEVFGLEKKLEHKTSFKEGFIEMFEPIPKLWIPVWAVLDFTKATFSIYTAEDIMDEELVWLSKMRDESKGVEVKDRRFRLKVYSNCFVGKQAVDWAIKNEMGPTRRVCKEKINNLLKKKLIAHVTNSHPFKDNYLYYRFVSSPISEFSNKSLSECAFSIDLNDATLELQKADPGTVLLSITLLKKKPILSLQRSQIVHNKSFYDKLRESENFMFRVDDADAKEWVYGLNWATMKKEMTTMEVEEKEREMTVECLLSELTEVVDNYQHLSYFLDYQQIVESERNIHLTNQEAKMFGVLREKIKDGSDAVSDDFILQALPWCIRATKHDLEKAYVLFHNYYEYLEKMQLFKISAKEIEHELRTEKLRWIHSRDKGGRALLVSQPCKHSPSKSAPIDILKLLFYNLHLAMEEEQTTHKGFSLISDGSGANYSNFDKRLPTLLISAVTSKFPARIGQVYIVNPPWYFRFVWSIVRGLISDHIASKVKVINSTDELLTYIDKEALLPEHGGTNDYDHQEWVNQRIQIEG
eukprot:CAMPEP_0174253836 /NCGR_PEP_ID=MMETSP0439-20130205/3190_1 /TAXON_ID=0 /ORGANISM="Stereomyxa ramosa, Strain Chinc5" /LENGTH=636 /DNA_ID=CAMNT_0015335093 /DNA_START=182 /DNA_END=2092 /DNA_ORIENTATION=-